MAPDVEGPSREEVLATDSLSARAGGAPRKGDGPTARRGIRTVVLSAVALVGLAGLAIGVLYTSLNPPESAGPDGRPEGQASRAGTGSRPPEAKGPAIAGTISVSPELGERQAEEGTLFIIARKGPGPPFAVKRIGGPRFPLPYRLGPEDVMVAGTPFEGEVSLSARLSKSGAAGPALRGDLEGEYPGQVAVGRQGVDIVIAHVR